MTNDPLYLNFDVWCIELYDHLRGQKYLPTTDDVDLLSGMYQCGMSAKEAAETLTATNTRVMTEWQLNYVSMALAAKKMKEDGSGLLCIILSKGEGFDFIVNPHSHPFELLTKLKDAILQYASSVKSYAEHLRKEKDDDKKI